LHSCNAHLSPHFVWFCFGRQSPCRWAATNNNNNNRGRCETCPDGQVAKPDRSACQWCSENGGGDWNNRAIGGGPGKIKNPYARREDAICIPAYTVATVCASGQYVTGAIFIPIASLNLAHNNWHVCEHRAFRTPRLPLLFACHRMRHRYDLACRDHCVNRECNFCAVL
jgi:hypothetical protein